MAEKFAELRGRISPDMWARSERKAAAKLAELGALDDTLAGYVRYAMPLTQPGILSDEEAASRRLHQRAGVTQSVMRLHRAVDLLVELLASLDVLGRKPYRNLLLAESRM